MGKKITLGVLLVIVIVGVLLQNGYVHNSTEKLTEDLERIKSALESDDLVGAASAADEFCANWEEHKSRFEAFFEHKEVDTISAVAKSLQSLCRTGSKEDALSHIAEEIFYINHIKDIDSFGWENVF